MDKSSGGSRWRRVLGAGLAVIGSSFLVLFVPILVYAFVLAFQVRGAPDQASINHFAASISPALMPWLVRALTLVLAFRLVRRAEVARAADGLLVGVVAGLLNLVVTLAFGGQLDVHNLLFFLIVVALGWLGGFVGQKMPSRS